PWGEVLNELCDRLADVALFGGIALASYALPALGFVTVVAIVLSSYAGILSKALGGPRDYSGIMAKADRMIALTAGAVLVVVLDNPGVFNWLLALLLVGAVATAIQRLRAIHARLTRLAR